MICARARGRRREKSAAGESLPARHPEVAIGLFPALRCGDAEYHSIHPYFRMSNERSFISQPAANILNRDGLAAANSTKIFAEVGFEFRDAHPLRDHMM